eukprot:CAMPEP_0175958754 /NCGR_PEP_ID=MMETSP0108-20121206/34419_1 /TAXON_ID=195067 ORGANISM="Goniomonas pacifica, Strain CCMP1869" /NCGR_SAMPLE_ID=MMETSP0108 /ASSEMBLY_ACC=CAM_ASM_000204 /LENGTH=95 /DNA_ID=CAMNT_0017286135 /DNA_START=6 /DNA_END=291 /DNA_ORIENTATION=+
MKLVNAARAFGGVVTIGLTTILTVRMSQKMTAAETAAQEPPKVVTTKGDIARRLEEAGKLKAQEKDHGKIDKHQTLCQAVGGPRLLSFAKSSSEE